MHVLASLGRCFDVVRELLVLGKLEGFLVGDFAFLLQVREVANQVDDDGGARVVADLAQPLVLYVVKALPRGDVEHKKDAVAALVEVARDRAERLLAGRIPNL